MLADLLRLDAQTVVYDLGSGYGRATMLFAMYAMLACNAFQDLSDLPTRSYSLV